MNCETPKPWTPNPKKTVLIQTPGIAIPPIKAQTLNNVRDPGVMQGIFLKGVSASGDPKP